MDARNKSGHDPRAPGAGLSQFISADTLWNELVAAHPEFVRPLRRGCHDHWFGEEPPGEPEISSCRIPVFSRAGGELSICCLGEFIDRDARKRRQAHRSSRYSAVSAFGTVPVYTGNLQGRLWSPSSRTPIYGACRRTAQIASADAALLAADSKDIRI